MIDASNPYGAAYAASERAHAISNKLPRYPASSMDALQAAARGDWKFAAQHHDKASKFHEGEKGEWGEEQHLKHTAAAAAHREAAIANAIAWLASQTGEQDWRPDSITPEDQMFQLARKPLREKALAATRKAVGDDTSGYADDAWNAALDYNHPKAARAHNKAAENMEELAGMNSTSTVSSKRFLHYAKLHKAAAIAHALAHLESQTGEQDWRPESILPEDQMFLERPRRMQFGKKFKEIKSSETAHEGLSRILAGKDTKRGRGKNTILTREPNGDISVVLHKTKIVTAHPNGDVTLNHGGWPTPLTRNHMAGYTGLPISLSPNKFSVYLGGKWHPYENGTRFPSPEVLASLVSTEQDYRPEHIIPEDFYALHRRLARWTQSYPGVHRAAFATPSAQYFASLKQLYPHDTKPIFESDFRHTLTPHGPVLDLDFSQHRPGKATGDYAVTGAGHAAAVFRHAAGLVHEALHEHKPSVLTFNAVEPSRQRLYDNLAGKVSLVHPDYTGYTLPAVRGTRYALVHKDAEPTFLATATKHGVKPVKLNTVKPTSKTRLERRRKLAAIPPSTQGTVTVRVPTPTPVATSKPVKTPAPTFILPG
jgi:hypothetical protein